MHTLCQYRASRRLMLARAVPHIAYCPLRPQKPCVMAVQQHTLGHYISIHQDSTSAYARIVHQHTQG
eukprot:3939832-Rhodomonas_salina.2